MFAKPECDDVLQPEPRSGEGCNTLSHSGLAIVNTQKRMLYRHCYFLSSTSSPKLFYSIVCKKMSTVTS